MGTIGYAWVPESLKRFNCAVYLYIRFPESCQDIRWCPNLKAAFKLGIFAGLFLPCVVMCCAGVEGHKLWRVGRAIGQPMPSSENIPINNPTVTPNYKIALGYLGNYFLTGGCRLLSCRVGSQGQIKCINSIGYYQSWLNRLHFRIRKCWDASLWQGITNDYSSHVFSWGLPRILDLDNYGKRFVFRSNQIHSAYTYPRSLIQSRRILDSLNTSLCHLCRYLRSLCLNPNSLGLFLRYFELSSGVEFTNRGTRSGRFRLARKYMVLVSDRPELPVYKESSGTSDNNSSDSQANYFLLKLRHPPFNATYGFGLLALGCFLARFTALLLWEHSYWDKWYYSRRGRTLSGTTRGLFCALLILTVSIVFYHGCKALGLL